MSARDGRSWGYWTQAKLGILADYLPAFLRASGGKASEYVYLDAFAGEGRGVDRLTGEAFNGSARIALEASDAGGFTRLRYFERANKARELEDQLRLEYPKRDIKVYGGDCNVEIPKALAELKHLRWAPTFAFIDPDGMEFAWRTLELIAQHKRGYRGTSSTKPEYKVELWLLFPTQGLIRTLALNEEKLLPEHVQGATRLYGTEEWRAIYERRLDGTLSAAEAREEYVNLMRWRLSTELGYAKTHPFELKNTLGRTVYHMVFATDNEAGDRIMADLYARAARAMPAMQQEARDRQKGQATLDLGDVDFVTATYEYEPPWKPPESHSS
jgi:three-Cys-motif partner protein